MSAPIYFDPPHDGAADPVVVRNRATGAFWMIYTARRAEIGTEGEAWIHGTRLGVAVSDDDGVTWEYRGTIEGLDPPGSDTLNTHWAPEVIRAEGRYHMFLTYTQGAPGSHEAQGLERHIVHYTSDDLVAWERIGPLSLASDRVIDAAVARCPDGLYRLWYKDEANGNCTSVATSPDLFDWTNRGEVIPADPPHEGPNVFELGGYWWMITDEWRGQAVHRSEDAVTWTRQDGLILAEPGAHPMDREVGRHADVVTCGDWAALYYFTHPFWNQSMSETPVDFGGRRTAIHYARLTVEDGILRCERDAIPAPLPADAG